MPSMDSVRPASADDAPAADTVVEMDMLQSPLVLDATTEDEVYKIVKCLEEIARVLANPDCVVVRSVALFLSLPNCLTYFITFLLLLFFHMQLRLPRFASHWCQSHRQNEVWTNCHPASSKGMSGQYETSSGSHHRNPSPFLQAPQ